MRVHLPAAGLRLHRRRLSVSYTTREAIAARRGSLPLEVLADADQDGAEDLGRVAGAIAEVDALIDGALARHWPAAVGISTPLLGMIAVDLVLDRLAVGLARTEEIIAAGKAATARLKDIQDGRLDPNPAAAGATPAATSGSYAQTWGGAPTMTRDGLGRLL